MILITSFQIHEEQIELIQPHINSGKFILIRISEEDLMRIQLLGTEDNRLSEQDWSAIFFAQEMKAILLSGDRHLKNIAETKGITVSGILWLLDQLLNESKISKQEACTYLTDLMLMNKRLPESECKKRLESWCR